MNPFSEYPQYDALDLAQLVQSGEVSAGESLDAIITKAVQQTPFAPIANITSQPAMSVPLYWSDDGLPHGAQFMAATGNDRLLLQLAAQLEQAEPWKHRMPPLCHQ